MEKNNLASPRETVKNSIRNWISDGSLKSGSLVPAENIVAEELSISRGTVRTAMDELELEGILERRNRRRYVTNRGTAPGGMNNLVLFLGAAENVEKFKNTGFLLAIQAGVMDRLAELKKHVISANFDKLEYSELDLLTNLRPEGALVSQEILQSAAGPDILKYLSGRQIPAVLEYTDSRYANYDRVVSNQTLGNYLLTKFAIDGNFKKILCFYPDNTQEYWYNFRHQGYRQAMQEANLTPMPPIIGRPMKKEYSYNEYHFHQAVMLNLGFLYDYFRQYGEADCIFANSDWEVAIIAAACRKLGRIPGKDIFFMGYDNKYMYNPWEKFEDTLPLATIDKHNDELGRAMVNTLFERINGKLGDKPVLKLIDPELVIIKP